MEIIGSGGELLKALTDMPIVIICLPLAFLSKDRIWKWMFLAIAIAAFGGCAAHGFQMGEMQLRFLWLFLYAFMIIAAYCFYMVFEGVLHCSVPEKQKKWALLSAAGVFLGCAVTRLITGANMIMLFVLYAVFLLIQCVAGLMKADSQLKEVKLLKISSGLLCMAVICQGMVPVLPSFNGAAAAHIFIIAAILLLFKLSRLPVKQKA